MKRPHRRFFGGTSGLWISRKRFNNRRSTEGEEKGNDALVIAPEVVPQPTAKCHANNDESKCGSPCLSSSSSSTESPEYSFSANKKTVDSLYVNRKKSLAKRKFGAPKPTFDCESIVAGSFYRVLGNESDSTGDTDEISEQPIPISTDDGYASDDLNFNHNNGDDPPVIKATEEKEALHPSLEVARSYFASLDETSLMVEESPEDSPGKHFKIRTRRCKISTKTANLEYQQYCDVCEESKVNPLPKVAFLDQRANYFRRAEVFDGMFDE